MSTAEHTAEPDWYERRNELEMGMIFNTAGWGIVMLDGYVPGDGTLMYVANWDSHNKTWCYQDSTVEPGDLVGEPMAEAALRALGGQP